MSYEMSMGIEFEGVSSSDKLTESFSQTVEHDTTDMYT